MRNILAIARKELTLYFTTPWAWLVLTAMAFFGSVSFVGVLSVFKQVHELAQQFTKSSRCLKFAAAEWSLAGPSPGCETGAEGLGPGAGTSPLRADKRNGRRGK